MSLLRGRWGRAQRPHRVDPILSRSVLLLAAGAALALVGRALEPDRRPSSAVPGAGSSSSVFDNPPAPVVLNNRPYVTRTATIRDYETVVFPPAMSTEWI